MGLLEQRANRGDHVILQEDVALDKQFGPELLEGTNAPAQYLRLAPAVSGWLDYPFKKSPAASAA